VAAPCGDGSFDDSDNEDNVASSKSNSSSHNTTRSQPQSKHLLEGELDEAREHEEFVKAVESWRKNGSSSDPLAMSAQKIAEQLSNEMEMEKESSSKRLQMQKEDAQRRLVEVSSPQMMGSR